MTPADFKKRFPEFEQQSDERVQMFIDDADPFFDQVRWGDLYDLGISYLVAHEIALANANAASAMTDDVVMKKVGDEQVQRDSNLMNKQSDNPYMRTTYGQKYLYYMRFVGAGGVSL